MSEDRSAGERAADADQDEIDPWRARWRPSLEAMRAIQILVLSWGPGPHRREYQKRLQIGEHLKQHSGNTDVRTSEELMDAEPEFRAFRDALDVEAIHAQTAEIIIGLLVPDAEVTGLRAELLDFRRNDHILRKVRLIVPKERGIPSRGILDTGIRVLPGEHLFRYTAKQLRDCQDIRAKCALWVQEARAAKFVLDRARVH